MSTKRAREESGKQLVTFVWPEADNVKQVFIAGDFNGWNPKSIRMSRAKGGFRRRVELTPGAHQYKFVVDGEWRNDPAATGRVPNGLGTTNSVIVA